MPRPTPPADRVCKDCGKGGLGRVGWLCRMCERKRAPRAACHECGKVAIINTRTEHGEVFCMICVRRRKAAGLAHELRVTAVGIVVGWRPDIDPALAMAAARKAAPTFRTAEWLPEALSDPSVLVSSTTAPPVIDRFVAELIAVGVTGISPPCCVRCGHTARLTQRLDGHRACEVCASKERLQTCGRCGRDGHVVVRTTDGQAICHLCYAMDRSRFEPCAKCERTRLPARRLADGSALCSECNKRIAICVVCGVERPCEGFRYGHPRCYLCAARRAPCTVCGTVSKVAVVWATGEVCRSCYHRAAVIKVVCEGCGQTRRPDPRHPSGQCSDCVGLPAMHTCRTCGEETRIFRHGLCWTCLLPHVFDTLTANAVVDVAPLRAALLVSDRSRSVGRWLETPFVTAMIARIAVGDMPLTHTAFDQLGERESNSVARVRAMLVTAGLLPARDETLRNFERWVAVQIAAITEITDRRVIERFATWRVLRAVRGRAVEGEVLTTDHARHQIRQAIAFLAFLRGREQTLGGCAQPDIDEWLAGPPANRHARDFVIWAVKEHLCHDIHIGHQPMAWPARNMSPAEHEDIVRRLLTDETLTLADRVSGLLVGCYAQNPSRLCRLTVNDVKIDGETVAIRFGSDDTILAGPIALCVVALIETRQGRAATDTQATSPWLFPGGLPGRPLSAETLALRLRRLNIRPRAMRGAMLMDLASDMPPRILGDLIGLDPTTATRWTRAAGGDWATYVAIRTKPAT